MCFILPAVLITGCFAWLYKEYGQLQKLNLLYGIQPGYCYNNHGHLPLATEVPKTVELRILGLIALIMALLNFNQIYILFGAGIFFVLTATIRKIMSIVSFFLPLLLFQFSKTTIATVTNLNLFFGVLKIGILYGSGYVLFAFLDAELVAKAYYLELL
jgi:chromate transporter